MKFFWKQVVSVSFLKEKLMLFRHAFDLCATLQLQTMGAFAEFKCNIIHQWQAEGIARMKVFAVEKGALEDNQRETHFCEQASWTKRERDC